MKKIIIIGTIITVVICMFKITSSYADTLESLTGIVIEKPWTKTGESWNAGGSEYYVLKVEDKDLPPEKKTAGERVILRPSKKIPFEELANYKDKRVLVKGFFLSGSPYKDVNNIEQSPAPIENPFTGELVYPLRGSGFEVYEITILKD